MWRRWSVLAAVALVVLLSAPAAADTDEEEPPKPSGVDIALRAGVGLPRGTLAGSTDFSALMGNLVPFTLEIGGRFNRDYTGAVFLQYGIGSCKGALQSCSAADYRFGLELLYRFRDLGSFTRSFTPWIGFGFGYEVLTLDAGTEYQGPSMLRGVELGLVQAGGDLHVTPSFAFGPYVSYSFGEFSGAGSATVALHSWLQLGIRGAWSLSSPGD